MNKDIIIFYLKRHVLGIVGLVLGIGFVAGGFVLLAEAKKGLEVSQNSMAKAESDRKTIQDSQIRVDSKNLETLSLVIGDFEKFNKESGKVFSANFEASGSQRFYKLFDSISCGFKPEGKRIWCKFLDIAGGIVLGTVSHLLR